MYFIYFRGYVHALKLSPNLRRQTNDVRKAMINGEIKKVWGLEVKKLDILLAMVNEPDEEEVEEDIEDF